jgi:hypothetical protein
MRQLTLVATLVAALALPSAAQNDSTYRAAKDLTLALLADSQRAITKDNAVSLVVTELQIAPMETVPAKYAVVVDTELIPTPGERGKTFSLVLDKPVDVGAATAAVARVASAYRSILINEPMMTVREIQLRVNMIRLDADEQQRFAGVAALFGTVANKSMFAPLTQILGLNDDQTRDPKKVLAFDGHFTVPLNYWAHSNARAIGLPVLTNDQPMP